MKAVLERISGEDGLPFELLLLADPSREMIESYIRRGQCFVAYPDRDKSAAIGVFVLLETAPGTLEIVNLAVREDYQGRGLGKWLVLQAIRQAQASQVSVLDVATGNSSIGQLALYQKCGFRMAEIDIDYFVRHYEEEIFEHGIRCRDRVRLTMRLKTVIGERRGGTLHDALRLYVPFELTGNVVEDVTAIFQYHEDLNTLQHIRNVAGEARRIAPWFGVEPDEAELAAWLHDISNIVPVGDMLDLAGKLNVAVEEEEHRYPRIIHQKLSRAMAAEMFGISHSAILDAVECHTTLKPNATVLDKVLFAADKLSWNLPGEHSYQSDMRMKVENRELDQAILVYLDHVWEQRAAMKLVHSWLIGAREELISTTELQGQGKTKEAALLIRPETERDFAPIRELLIQAFGQREDEARLVERIRASAFYIPAISLVAERDGNIVGHLLLSMAHVINGDEAHEVIVLAPLAVTPACQKQGIGKALMEEGLKKCRTLGYPLIMLIGHPAYYPKFGFRPARALGFELKQFRVPDEVFMVYGTGPDETPPLRGELQYPPAFGDEP